MEERTPGKRQGWVKKKFSTRPHTRGLRCQPDRRDQTAGLNPGVCGL